MQQVANKTKAKQKQHILCKYHYCNVTECASSIPSLEFYFSQQNFTYRNVWTGSSTQAKSNILTW